MSSIAVSTDLIRFTRIGENPEQQAELKIQNKTQRPVKVRMQHPKTSNFTVSFDNLQSIAPGMVQTAYIQFIGDKQDQEFLDEIVIMTGNEKVNVRLEALTHFTDLRVITQQIDAGIFCIGETQTIKFPVFNQGVDTAEIFVESQQLQGYPVDLVIVPMNALVDPGTSTDIQAQLNCKDAGSFHFLIKITDKLKTTLTIQLIATAITPQLFLCDENNDQLPEDLIFKSLFFNEQKRELRLSNPTPFDMEFNLDLELQESSLPISKEIQFFKIEPSNGTIQANETLILQLTFQPKLELVKVDQINQFMQKFTLTDHVPNTGSISYVSQKNNYDVDLLTRLSLKYKSLSFEDEKSFNLAGFARRPFFQFDQVELIYNQVAQKQNLVMKSICDEVVSVKVNLPVYITQDGLNGKREIWMTFQPREQKIFTLTFQPKAMLKLNECAKFQLGNQYFIVTIPIYTKFADPKIIGHTKTDSNNGTFRLPNMLQNSQVLTQSQVNQEQQNAQHKTYNTLKFNRMKTDQNFNYNAKYLEKANNVKEPTLVDNALSAYNDGLDLGMGDTAYDPENEFKDSRAIDKHRTTFAYEQLEQAETQSDAILSTKERPALRNLLQPATHTYFRDAFDAALFNKIEHDCKNKLQQRQLQLVSTGGLELDVGEIQVNTELIRYFKIANDLVQYIKIELKLPEQKDEFMTEDDIPVTVKIQPAQWLPPSCYTSFQLTMHFRKIDPQIIQPIHVYINGHHEMTLKIKAIVTRPKLQLSCKTYDLTKCKDTLINLIDKIKQLQIQKATMDQEAQLTLQLSQEALYFELNSQNAFSNQIVQKVDISNIGTSQADCVFELIDYEQSPSASIPASRASRKSPSVLTKQRQPAQTSPKMDPKILGNQNNFLDLSCKEQLFEPNDFGQLRVTWNPSNQDIACKILAVQFKQGYQPYYTPIICKLTPGRGKIIEKSIDCGIFNVNKPVQVQFSVQNLDDSKPLYYEMMLDKCGVQYMTLVAETNRGEIQPGSTQALSFTIEAQKPGQFQFKLPVRVIGGDLLQITVKGAVEIPKLFISHRDMKTLGANNSTNSTNINMSASSATEAISMLKDNKQSQQNAALSTNVFNFDSQFFELPNPLIAKAQHIQRFYICNNSRVTADLFIDVRHIETFELLESEAEEGVQARFISFDNLQKMFNVYKQVNQKHGKHGYEEKSKQKFSLTQKKENQSSVADEMSAEFDALQKKLGIPLFTGANDFRYSEFTCALMANINMTAHYGDIMQNASNTESLEKHKQFSKLMYLQIDPGKQYQLNLQIIEQKGGVDVSNLINFYCLGQNYKFNELNDNTERPDDNQMVLKYSTTNSIIQLSSNKLTYGIKVADVSFKANRVDYPLGCKDLHYEFIEKNVPIKYMEQAANSGLFSKDLSLSNQQNCVVRYVAEVCDISEMAVSDSPYKLTHPIGVVGAYESLQMRIYYSPVDVGPHNYVLRFYYTDDQGIANEDFFGARNYRGFQKVQILLQGVAVHKCLSFSCHELILPNTYVNIPTRATFFIYNIGYKNNTKLQIFFPPELSKCVLMVQFPWGNVVNHMVKVLPVVITFVSDIQMSFKSQISILDSNNIPYHLNISGNSFENSYSLQSYLEYNYDRMEKLDNPTQDVKYPIITPIENKPIPTIEQLTTENGKPYGVNTSTIQALKSIKAKSVIDISDYGRSLKIDSLIKIGDYTVLESLAPVIVDEKKSKSTNQSMNKSNVGGSTVNKKAKLLAEALNSPIFVTSQHPTYSHMIYHIKFLWQWQFKQQPNSEAPLSIYLPFIPDQLFLQTDSQKSQFQLLIQLLEKVIGLQIPPANAINYVTAIQNRQSGFLLQIQSIFKQAFQFTPKELQNISIIENQRCDFFRQAFESMLSCLKIKGALLNNIPSSLLLSKTDFLNHCRKLIQKEAEVCFTKPGEQNMNANQASQYLLSQQQQQNLLEVLGFLHNNMHQSAWATVLYEIGRIYLINFATDEKIFNQTLQKHKTFISTDGQAFNIIKTVTGKPSAQDINRFVQASQTVYQVRNSTPQSVLLTLLNYFTHFQLFKLVTTAKPSNLTNFQQTMSGVQIGCFICSYVYSQNIVNHIEDVLSIAQKILEIKQQKAQYSGRKCEATLLECCNTIPGEPGVTEKLMNQLDSARQQLWRDIAQFVRTQFSIITDERTFYTSIRAGNGQGPSVQQLSANGRAIMLLTAFLYQSLPSYLPSKTMRLSAMLGQTLDQVIEVSALKQSLHYACSILYCDETPSCDVTLNQTQLFLEAKNNGNLHCKIVPKFIKKCSFLLQLQPIYDGVRFGVPQANIIAVETTVIDKSVKKEFKVESKCGQALRTSVPVENPAQLDAKYSVTLKETFYAIDPNKPVNNPVAGKSPTAFKADKVFSVDPKQTKDLVLIFTPAHPGLYVVQIELFDDRVGQQVIEMRGFALVPDPLKTIRLLGSATESMQFEQTLHDLNIAPKECENQFKYALIPINNQMPLPVKFQKDQFVISYTPRSKLPDGILQYKLIILLDSMTKVYMINLQLIKKQEQQTLEFECPAKSTASNKITITNNDELDHDYILLLVPQDQSVPLFVVDNSKEKEVRVRVPKKSQESFLIRFEPKWIGTQNVILQVKHEEGVIVMADYLLKGEATEPEPKGVITLKGKAAEIVEESQGIKNSAPEPLDIQIKISEDDNNVFSLPKTNITILGTQTGMVNVQAKASKSGEYEGKLHLIYPDKTYDTYLLKYIAEAKECAGEFQAICAVGESAEIKIDVNNDVGGNEYVTYQANVQNLPKYFLKFPDSLYIAPNETGSFIITFQPQALGNWDGKIVFSSDQAGETWYKVNLKCNDLKEIEDRFEAPIGDGQEKTFTLHNQTDMNLFYIAEVSTRETFQVSNGAQFQLKPGNCHTIKVLYSPTAVDVEEECIMDLVGKDQSGNIIQQQRYRFVGIGSMKDEIKEVNVQTLINQAITGQFNFRNPFLARASVHFDIDSTQDFEFQYNNDILLDGRQTTTLQYIFLPQRLAKRECELRVIVNPNYDQVESTGFTFRYRFIGIGEYIMKTPIAFLQIQCRQTEQQLIKLPEDVKIEEPELCQLTVEAASAPGTQGHEELNQLIKRAVQVNWEENQTLRCIFSPLKPFQSDVLLSITEPQGGRYKFVLTVKASPPPIEDVLQVELPDGNTPGELRLRHRNLLPVFSEFKAYFASGSSERFSVSPSKGILEPASKTGNGRATEFIIKCAIGSAPARGQLVIETRDVIFLWDVQSAFKKYIPPVGRKK